MWLCNTFMLPRKTYSDICANFCAGEVHTKVAGGVTNLKMEKIEAQTVTEYLVKKGMAIKVIPMDMMQILIKGSSVNKKASKFKRDMDSTEDDPRSGRPKNHRLMPFIAWF